MELLNSHVYICTSVLGFICMSCQCHSLFGLAGDNFALPASNEFILSHEMKRYTFWTWFSCWIKELKHCFGHLTFDEHEICILDWVGLRYIRVYIYLVLSSCNPKSKQLERLRTKRLCSVLFFNSKIVSLYKYMGDGRNGLLEL